MNRSMQFGRVWLVLSLLAVGLAIVLGGAVSTAQASVLMYEGFNYTSGLGTTLNGQNGGTGFATGSSWNAGNMGGYPSGSPTGFGIVDSTEHTLWNGTVTSVPQTGNFAGSPAPTALGGSLNGNNPDALWASRSLDPSVTATFTLGAVTWMSYVEASNFKANANGTGGDFAIGKGIFNSGTTTNRGWTTYGGEAIGIGITSAKQFTAAIWTGGAGPNYNITGPAGAAWNTNGVAQIGIAKIVWGNASNPTTIYEATFNDGTVLTEAAFNTAAVTNSATIDPTTFNMVSLGGNRYNVDELRIGTTFNDAIGVVVASTGNYWAPGASGGGTGTWNSGATVWATAPGAQGAGTQATTGALVFSGATGTVTIDGTVSVAEGLHFQTDGYSIIPGASTPNLTLTGANLAANTINVDSGKTTTISAQVNGSNGMTKDGGGKLILSNASNGYGGDTSLKSGVLQIADAASLGTGNVSFNGGTLQYPAGSGATSIDVSSKIPTVAIKIRWRRSTPTVTT